MASTPSATPTGEGTRPTTSGGVDNIGGASAFTPGKSTTDGDTAPQGVEKMAEKKVDRAAVKQDDSAPLGLTESTDDGPNTETPGSHDV
jgi:hypothetical protein